MSDFLQTMAASSAERAAAVASKFVSTDFDKPVVPLRLGDFDVIAEIKDRSPAEGALKTKTRSRVDQATSYAAGGAAAISVLTEPSRFDGKLAHLEEVVAAVPGTPVMRKDFLVAPVQVDEARKAGASGVLLIAALLSDKKLREMLDVAWQHGMFVLLESFDENDLARSSKLMENADDCERAGSGQLLFGVNTRNLRTLEVDNGRLRKLAARLPTARCVAESGLRVAEDAAKVAGYGYRLALVGTALMRSDDPAALVAAMRDAGSAGVAA
ncbi:MAG: indole-3-glycerol-phosphate synthase [Gammaproteobacteria bacterium]|nr:indole-3-glycerol-phosphate synthase [Gammaproteobacteria bacterium]MBT8109980.1 indole-3-glycerol-phosphate synthase [Gammaproteobacteria bacterium]NND47317.1 indole-3-glycerol-phosphate synthase [Woeseiaceae bacterium]NNL44682.1 indole-3-glycerol-phosphate synthase [Woeseiaceae bacterium]